MADAGSLWINLGLHTAKFRAGIARAKQSMNAFEKSVKPTVRAFEKFGKGLEKTGASLTKNLTLPILAAGAAIGIAVGKMSSYGSEINDMSVRTGFSRESLQELKFAADQTGVSMESIEGSTRRLTKSIGEAATGQGNSAKLFEQLGVSIKNADGSLRPVNEIFNDTISALGRIPDETTRNVIAMDLLGKSAGDLTPLMAEGKEGLNKFAKEARDAGLVMSEEAIIAADNFGDKMDKLKSQLSHAGMEIGTAFMPVIEQLISFIQTSVIPAVKNFGDWFKNLTTTQKDWVVGIAAALAALGPLASIIGKISGMIGGLISGISKIAGVMAGIGAPVMITVGALLLLGKIIMDSVNWSGGWSNLWDDMKEDMVNFVEYAKGAMKVIGGVLTGDLATIQKGVDQFDAAIQKGAINTLTRMARHAAAVNDAKKAQDELTKITEDTGKAQDNLAGKLGNLNVNLDKTTKEAEKLTETFTDLSFLSKKFGETDFDAGIMLRANLEFGSAKKDILNFKNDFKQTIETAPKPLLPPPDTNLFKKGMTDLQLVMVTTFESTAAAFSKMVDNIQQKTKTVTDIISGLIGSIGAVFSESMTNQEIALDNRYAHEKDLIENSKMTEEQKTAALKTLGDREAKDRKTLMLKKAKMDKASALLGATVAGARAVVEALSIMPPPVGIAFSIVLGALAAAQIALIASRPLPTMAEGGLVFGETLALIGEGNETSSTNPEVIAPLDKLMGMIAPASSMNGGEVIFTIHGETLRGVLLRTERNRKFTAR